MDKGKWYISFFVILLMLPFSVDAQQGEKWWVFFTDKGEQSFDPHSFFHPKAIERRVKNGLPIYDETDIPVNNNYTKSLIEVGCQVLAESRWLNGCCVLFQGDIATISSLPFVLDIEPLPLTRSELCAAQEEVELLPPSELKRHALAQTRILGGETLHRLQLNGKGVRIAIFDAGFKGYKTLPHFEHLRRQGRIEKTLDFVGKDENVDGHSKHGTMVFSCIAGWFQEIPLGLAQEATFLLARTERNFGEYLSEEEHWLEAAEWADKEGVDIINSSLGYTYHRYFYQDMDGQTSIVSRAANMAAKKGILVVNSAGNSGDEDWQFIGAPADADSVLSVGGIDPYTGAPIDFTSFGPTFDQRKKPNISAFGVAAVASKNGLELAPGTSFSAPLITGFAACLLQQHPEMTNMDLFHRVERAGHLFPYYDYSQGHGVPSIDNLEGVPAFGNVETLEVKDAASDYKRIVVSLGETDHEGVIERMPDYVYWQTVDQQGHILYYQVVKPEGVNGGLISDHRLKDAAKLRITYKRQYREIDLD